MENNKYSAKCFNNKGKEIFSWNLEARDRKDAEASGFLQCYDISGEDGSIKVKVEKLN